MNRCPELSDLELFFRTPAAAEGGKAGYWFHDTLRFRSVGPSGTTLVCVVEPAYGTFTLQHSRADHIELNLSFQRVVSLDLESSAGQHVLIGHVSAGAVEQVFKLRLVPEFSFTLVTSSPQ